jgi:hypothetical protein
MGLDVEKLPVPTCYVRQQMVGADGFKEIPSNVSEEHWEPLLTRAPEEYTEAIAIALELFYETEEVRNRTWVETWITPGDVVE